MLINVQMLNDGLRGRDGKSPYIGDNGHWFTWDDEAEEWIDTGVIAGTGPTITEVYVNPDYSITFFFSDGTSYTTPPIKGVDGTKIIYWTDSTKNYEVEGIDDEGVYHTASTGSNTMYEEEFPYGYPEEGDYIVTKGGCVLRCIAVNSSGVLPVFDWVCVANLNGTATIGNEFTVPTLYVTGYANIVGFIFREVVIDGVTHFRLE